MCPTVLHRSSQPSVVLHTASAGGEQPSAALPRIKYYQHLCYVVLPSTSTIPTTTTHPTHPLVGSFYSHAPQEDPGPCRRHFSRIKAPCRDFSRTKGPRHATLFAKTSHSSTDPRPTPQAVFLCVAKMFNTAKNCNI